MAANQERRPYGLRIPPKGKTYVYDFQYPAGGPRYSKSTRTAVYREALKIASKAYSAVEEEYKRGIKNPGQKPEIALREAFDRFYDEKGCHYANPTEQLQRLAKLCLALGPDRCLHEVTTGLLLEYRTTRRKQVGPRTVNGEVVDLMRAIYKQARLWEYELGELGKVSFDWSQLKLETTAHRTRVATKKEQKSIFKHLRKDYHPIIRFALLTGLRKAALILRQDQIDWDNNLIIYTKKSKRTNDTGVIPMSKAVRELLRAEIELTGSQSPFVFTYHCERGLKKQGKVIRKRGQRYPITYSGLTGAMKKATGERGAKLSDWRVIHDLRHTAATEVLRAGANLVAVQQLLGHSDVSQTSRYTNLITEDVLNALEARDGSSASHESSHENGIETRAT